MTKPINDTPYCPPRCQGVNHELFERMVEALRSMIKAMEPLWYEEMGDNYHLAPEYKALKALLAELEAAHG